MYHIIFYVTIALLNKYEFKIFIGADLFFVSGGFEKQIAISIKILSKIIIKYFSHRKKKKERRLNFEKRNILCSDKGI